MKILLLLIATLAFSLPSYAKRGQKKNQMHMEAHLEKMQSKRDKMKEHREKMKSNRLETKDDGEITSDEQQKMK